MLRQIEKIQKMVNSLLGHCCEAGADVAPNPSSQEDKYEDLGVMILKAQDGDLPQRSIIEMNRWIMNDTSVLDYYVDFQHMTALLKTHFNPSRFHVNLSCETTAPCTD